MCLFLKFSNLFLERAPRCQFVESFSRVFRFSDLCRTVCECCSTFLVSFDRFAPGLLLVLKSPVCQIRQPFEPFLNLLKIVRSAPLSHLLLVKSSSPFDFSNSIVSLDWFAPLSKLYLQLLVTSLVSLELCSSLSVSLIFFMHPCSCFSGSSLSSGLRASRS